MISKLTRWRNKKSSKYCEQEGTDADIIFCLKCLMQTSPYFMLLTCFIFLSFICGFAVRTLEWPFYENDSESDSEIKGNGY